MRTSDEEFPKGGRLILLKSTLSSLPTSFFFFGKVMRIILNLKKM